MAILMLVSDIKVTAGEYLLQENVHIIKYLHSCKNISFLFADFNKIQVINELHLYLKIAALFILL